MVSSPSSLTTRMMISSITAVRTIIGHAQRRPCGIDARICSPVGPAKRRAYVSWNNASDRSLSMARYSATQRAVSETLEIGLVAGDIRAKRNLTGYLSPGEPVAQLVEQRTFNPKVPGSIPGRLIIRSEE